MSIARIAGYLFLTAAAIFYTFQNIIAIEGHLDLHSDFELYYNAAREILRGNTPYSNPEFMYPAVFAFSVTPLALTSYLTARWIWFVISHLMLLGSSVLIWRFLGGGLATASCIALVWAGGGAAGENLALGQIGPALLLLLALAYTRCGVKRGIAAGVGAALKFLPAALAVPITLARDRRSLISMLTTAAGLFLVSGIALPLFDGPQTAGRAYLLGTPAILSWSIPSTALRFFDPPAAGGALPHDWEFGNQVRTLHLPVERQLISAALSFTVLISGTLILVWRTGGRIDERQLPVAMAGFVSLALAALPVCWSHYQILQYAGVALMLGLAVSQCRWKLAITIIACGGLLYPIPVAALTRYYHHYGWTAASPWQLYLWTSATPVACLGIFGLSVKFLLPQSRNADFT